MSLSEKLRELRDGRNWSQQTIADMMNIGRSTISRYETGVSIPNYETLVRFAEVFRVDKEYLVGELDPLPTKTGFQIEENLADADLDILKVLFQQIPDLKKSLIDLHLLPPKQKSLMANIIIAAIKAAKKQV